jgi:hypothetical protein
MRSNPIVTKVLLSVVSDGKGRTTMGLVESLPKWLRQRIWGNEEDYLRGYSNVLSKIDDYWYKKGEEPIPDYTR